MLYVERNDIQRGCFSFDGDNRFPRIERLIGRYWECKP